jgi:hypothetical protein
VDEFKVNLLKVQDEMKESQQVSAQLQFFYQNKLAKHQEDHDNEIDDLKIRHEERLAELKELRSSTCLRRLNARKWS